MKPILDWLRETRDEYGWRGCLMVVALSFFGAVAIVAALLRLAGYDLIAK